MPAYLTKADVRHQRSFYYDLLGIPYVQGGRDPSKGLDCLGSTIVVLERLFGPAIADDFDAFTPEAHTSDFAALAAWRMAEKDRWKVVSSGYVGTCTSELGDVVVQVSSADNLSTHVSVIVHCGKGYPTIALTSDKKRGVVCIPASRLRNILAVYRYKQP